MRVASKNLFFALDLSPSCPHNENMPIHLLSFYPCVPRLDPRVKAILVHATDSPSPPWAINLPIGTVVSSSARALFAFLFFKLQKTLASFFSMSDGQQQAHRRGLLRCSSAASSPFGVRPCLLFRQYCISDLLSTICSSL